MAQRDVSLTPGQSALQGVGMTSQASQNEAIPLMLWEVLWEGKLWTAAQQPVGGKHWPGNRTRSSLCCHFPLFQPTVSQAIIQWQAASVSITVIETTHHLLLLHRLPLISAESHSLLCRDIPASLGAKSPPQSHCFKQRVISFQDEDTCIWGGPHRTHSKGGVVHFQHTSWA